MNEQSGKRFGAAALGAWVAVFVLARGWLVLALADVFFYGEEYAKGAGKALLDGLPLAHWQLAYHPYEGGGFATSHLDALVFAVLGPSLAAQKLVALGFAVAILCVGARFAARWFGATSAHVFSALYVFAPASLQKLGLLNLGIHYQALLFSLLVAHYALRLGFEPEARARTWFAFGLAAGFGFFFSYQCALAIAPAALWLAWQARGRLRARAGWAVGGALLGLAPLFYMAWHTRSAVFDIHGADVAGAADDPAKLDVLAAFWSSVVGGRDAWELAGVFALPLAALCALVAARGGGLGLREARVARGLVFVALALFLVTYVASTFAVGEVYHYFRLNRLCPAWMGCVLLAAAGFADAPVRGRRRTALVFAVAVALATGASDVLREARCGAGGTLRERVQLLVHFKGYDYRDWLGKVLPRTELERADRARVGLAFDEAARDWLAASVGGQVWLDFPGTLDEAIVEALAVEPDGALLLGFGPILKRKLGGTLRVRVEWLATLAARPEVERSRLAQAAGRFGSRFVATEDVVRAELDELRGVAAPDAFWRGLGWRLFEAVGDAHAGYAPYWEPVRPPLWARRDRAVLFVAREDPRVAAAILAGYDEARAARTLP